MWWPIIQAIFSGVTGSVSTAINNYLDYKKQETENRQELKLAELNANKEMAIAVINGDINQRANYLNSVSKKFRQGTFYLTTALILFGTLLPDSANWYWDNFDRIPVWLRGAWLGMIGVTWGFPISKEYLAPVFSSIAQSVTNYRESRQSYKLEKYRINRQAYFAKKRELSGTLSQEQVDADNAALDAGETENGQ